LPVPETPRSANLRVLAAASLPSDDAQAPMMQIGNATKTSMV
jgi:hypothetical protein